MKIELKKDAARLIGLPSKKYSDPLLVLSRKAAIFLFLLPLMPVAALAQPVSFGAQVGVPLTDFFYTSSALPQPGLPPSRPFTSTTNRYLIGPTVELRLPLRLSVEFDALYRHYKFSSPGFVTAPPVIYIMQGGEHTQGGDWEFPLMAKYHFTSKSIRPYAGAGPVWDRLGESSSIVCAINCGSSSTPPELLHNTVTGFVAAVGIDSPRSGAAPVARDALHALERKTLHSLE